MPRSAKAPRSGQVELRLKQKLHDRAVQHLLIDKPPLQDGGQKHSAGDDASNGCSGKGAPDDTARGYSFNQFDPSRPGRLLSLVASSSEPHKEGPSQRWFTQEAVEISPDDWVSGYVRAGMPEQPVPIPLHIKMQPLLTDFTQHRGSSFTYQDQESLCDVVEENDMLLQDSNTYSQRAHSPNHSTIASQYVGLHHTLAWCAPHDAVVTPCYSMPPHTPPHHTTPRHTTPRLATPHRCMPCHATRHHAASRIESQRNATPHRTAPLHATSRPCPTKLTRRTCGCSQANRRHS